MHIIYLKNYFIALLMHWIREKKKDRMTALDCRGTKVDSLNLVALQVRVLDP